ncbi:MAG TPA: S8 family serine peptidase [Candidatus Limnocylindrales bacterium]|nr:S8 family serine peptidase [Candidatus Limnocylindrales bacterium]
MHRRAAALLATLALLVSASGAFAIAPPASRDATAAGAVLDKSSAIVVFRQLPLATYDGRIQGYEKTRPSTGKLNANSAAARKYLGYLQTKHSAFQKWLQTNVPSAKITSQYYTTLNAVAVRLNGAAIGKLRENTDVLTVEYNALYRPDMSESYKLISAAGAWAAAGGRAEAGRGVKVGIIDSGIDHTHPFFDPAGFSYPAGFPKCDAADTSGGACINVSPKVIVARVFYNKNNQTDYTARPIPDVGDHGSHVAGTVAGVTGKTAVVEGVAIDDMSGVAPGAWLGNYNVFPGEVISSRSEDILNAVEQAVLDGMDVLNLSLGGGYRGNNDLLAKGLDTAVAAGVVVVASAGNNGPGGFTIGSPGRARDIITVGASTNQHFVGQPLTYGGTTVGAAVGDFPPLPGATFALFVSGDATSLSNACTSLPASTQASELVLVTRGVCTFSTKVRTAIAAGYDGVIVRNNVAGDPTAMAKDGLGDDELPAVMLGKSDGDALRAAAPATVTAVASFSEFITPNGDILAGFSSQGPTFVDYAIKPDLTSVGVNVLSSTVCDPGNPCGNDGDWAFFSGTSMSSPHVAGSAAVLKDLNPTWSPAAIKSALANTADLVVKNAFDASTTVGPLLQGGGREDLTEAAATDVLFWPTSASFGRISGSRTNSTSMTIRLTNLTATSRTLAIEELRWNPAAGALGATFGGGSTSSGDSRIATPSSITIPANGTANLTVSVDANLALGSIVQGWLKLTGGGDDYQVAYWAQVAP